MRILIDMNLSPLWVDALIEAEIEAVHWSTIGDPAATDRVIMSYAQTHGYIVFTNDLDFGTLLAITKSQLPSVIQVRNQDLLPAAIGDVVISALRQVEQQLASGALVTIDQSRLRIRILPIG
jgi:predicted nuclease of predicted toxin-antitoxin system